MKYLFLAIIFFLPIFVHAQVSITEIMYDVSGTDTGREWVEIKNIGSNPIDLSSFKFFEANTNHKIIATKSSSIISGGFAIIADNSTKFLEDHPGFSGLLFDSTFSLSNEGETIAIHGADPGNIDSVSYLPIWGAGGDGNSLQKTSLNTWISSIPTPGVETVATESTVSSNQTVTNNISSSTEDIKPSDNANPQIYSTYASQEIANTSYDEPEFEVSSGRTRLGFVGVPLAFEAKIKNSKNISPGNSAIHKWSMGDGSIVSGQFISHIYEYPGDYLVILNSIYGGASAVSKVDVKIVKPDVVITDANNEYIEIKNQDDKEVNIGKWILETYHSRFIIPEDTIISPHLSLKIASKTSKLSTLKDFVRIDNPSGVILSSFNITLQEPTVTLPQGMSISDLEKILTSTFKK